MTQTATSISQVVRSGLCIGCGLCESLTEGRVKMQMSPLGGLRPMPLDDFSNEETSKILSACPGVIAEAPETELDQIDPIWGAYSDMRYAWAGDPETRHRGATGGVLTALGMQLIDSGQVDFILQVRAIPDKPMRSEWVMSETSADVLAHAGSRYGPASALAGLSAALDRNQRFAIIAKPCDLGAVYRLAQSDPRVDALCVARLTMVCGGQSRLTKSQGLLAAHGLREDELTLFRYRGYGNPGLTTLETKDGRRFETTYQELWEDEGTWDLETRCKLCPDALGEAADIAAADVWPGGGPTGEDVGFNGIVTRNARGAALIKSAVAAGALTLGETITPAMFNDFQPHQVRKKHAAAARLAGMEEAGLPTIETRNLRLDVLGQALDANARAAQIQGIGDRVTRGKITEDFPQ